MYYNANSNRSTTTPNTQTTTPTHMEMPEFSNSHELRVAYFDGAVAYGGSLQVLSLLFGAIDRDAVKPLLIACAPKKQLLEKFVMGDIGLLLNPRLSYAVRDRWLRFFNKWGFTKKLASYIFSIAAFFAALPSQLHLFKYLLTQKPDVIHVNNSFTPIIASLLLGIPIVWHIHGIPGRQNKYELALLKRVGIFVAISTFVANKAASSGYPESRITVIHNPAPPNKPREITREAICSTYRIDHDCPIIAHIGRIVRWKGQLEFLKAFTRVTQQHPKAVALIVGDDSENFGDDYPSELKKWVAQSNISDKVRFAGHTPNSLDVMRAADIVVHSSIEPEPFGLVIVEAMTAGTAVVAANIGAPSEIISSGENGVLANPSDSEALSEAILDLLKNTERRARIASNGKRTADSLFRVETYATKWIAIYQSLAKQRTTQRHA